MNESTTSKTYHCDQCAVLLTDENHGFFQWRARCNRCHSRLELDNDLLEIADVANQFYKSDDQVINLQHDLAVTRLRVQELKKPIEDGGDSRLTYIWQNLWDGLERRFDRDEVWGLIVDNVEGAPEFREEEVSGTITLTFSFSDLKIPGGLEDNERDDAIIEAYLEDASFDQDEADSTEVEED
jgi:hypothetical protein